MRAEPLKNKRNNIFKVMEDSFPESDVLSAVEWLKEKILEKNHPTYNLWKELNPLIDEAFEDVMKKEKD